MKKLLTILTGASLALGGVIALSSINEQKAEKVSAVATKTVTSAFGYDAENLSVGTAGNKGQRFLVSGTDPLNNVSLSLFYSSDVDTNVSLKFNGGTTNYPQGNLLRKYDGNPDYLQLRYASNVEGDGGGIAITPNVGGTIIKSISIKIHDRTSESRGTYHHVTVNGVSSYSDFTTLFTSENSYTHTWSNENGITSFAFTNSLKDSTVEATEKYTFIEYVSITYELNENVKEVSFNTHGGSEVASQYVTTGEYATEPATDPTKESTSQYRYHFAGWYTSDSYQTEFDFKNTPITADTIIHAKWTSEEITEYVVTFVSEGSVIDTQNVTVGEKATQPSYVKPGDERYSWQFKAWYLNADYSGSTFDIKKTAPTSDMTLYARWTRIGTVPSGAYNYNVKSGIQNSGAGWGEGEGYDSFASRHLVSTSTFDSKKPELVLDITSNGSSTSGMKRNGWEFQVNDTTITVTSTDSSKIIVDARAEFLAQNYTAADNKNITLSVGGVTKDSQAGPIDGYAHVVVMSSFETSERVRSFDITVLDMGGKGAGLTNLIITYATYTDEMKAEDFASDFLAAMRDNDVCGSTQSRWSDNNYERLTDGGDDSVWSTWKDNFEALSESVQGYFKTSENETIAEARNLYLHIITRYSSIAKWGNGPTTSGAYIGMNAILGDNSTTIATVISVIVISIAGVSFLIFRKKKHE